MAKKKKRIMYICESCEDQAPECCGHFDRKELRVTNDGAWLCEGCWDEDESTGDIPFDKAPFMPPEYPEPRQKTESIYRA